MSKTKWDVDYDVNKCGGQRRIGSFMSLGPVTWVPCKGKPIVLLIVTHSNRVKEVCPACQQCWEEAIEGDFKIKVEPLISMEEYKKKHEVDSGIKIKKEN